MLPILNFSQVLMTENFNSYSIGNIASDLTGATAGTSGYYIQSGNTSAPLSDFQFKNESGNNILSIQGASDAVATNDRYVWKDGLNAAWATRTSGNNVITVDVKIFTGNGTTSKNSQSVYVYNADFSKVLVGFVFVPETRVLSGVAYYNNAGTLDDYAFNLVTGGLVLNANQWVNLSMSFNKTTGAVRWYAPGMAAPGGVTGASIGIDPAELDFVVLPGTSNALSYEAKFDDVVVNAVATSNLSSQDFNTLSVSNFVAYPNPTSDFINLSILESNAVKSISLYDINGREVKSFSQFVDSIDVSDLTSGIFMLTVETENGKSTQKIVKE